MTVILFDLIVLAILAGFTIRGGVRGFVLSLCSLLAVVVAFLGAGAAARALSPMAAEFLEPKFAAVIEERLEEALQEQVEQGQQALAPEEVPLEGVLALLREMGFYDSLVNSVDQAVEKGLTHAAASAAAKAAAALAQSAAYQIIFIISFLLLLAVWQLVSRALDLVARLPGLQTLNRSLGAVLGLAQGCILVFLLAWLLRFGRVVDQAAVEQTVLLRFFMNTSPLTLLGGLK